MPANRAERLIGLAMKAGRITAGTSLCESSIREGKAFLVIVAGDASDNTKKRMRDKCGYYEVPLIEYSDKASLGKMIGKEERSAAAVTDRGFAEAIQKSLASENI